MDSNALTLLQMAISDEGEGSADVGPLGDTEGEMYPNVQDTAGKRGKLYWLNLLSISSLFLREKIIKI